MQSIPSDVLDEIFDLIEAAGTRSLRDTSKEPKPKLSKIRDLSKLTDSTKGASSYGDNELALTLFPECREWLEEDHRYDHTPEMYISAYFNRTNDLEYQYRMVRYMELRPTETNKNIVIAWYKELRKKRSNSFDDKPILPGVPDYPVFAL